MDPQDPQQTDQTPNETEPAAGYQPTTGRKLFMFLLCLFALIAIWSYYWFALR